jgi:hypothetical protein
MNKTERANTLLTDDFFMGEISSIKRVCIDQITNSNPEDYDQREEAYRLYKAVDAVLNHFKSIAAQTQINEKRWKIL